MRFISVLLVIVFLLTACVAPQAEQAFSEQVEAATPDPVETFAEFLNKANRAYLEGNYKEAILNYSMAVDIEPKSFDAQIGLGKSYRRAKQPEKAIGALEAAKRIWDDNRELLLELTSSYFENTNFDMAKKMAREQWENDENNMDAGLILFIILAIEEEYNEVLDILDNDTFRLFLTIITDEYLLFKLYSQQLTGIQWYNGGYLYIGELVNGKRVGKGLWIDPEGYFFRGEWDNDLPNGVGEYMLGTDDKITGTWQDGIEHGDMEAWRSGEGGHTHYWKYQCIEGIPQVSVEIDIYRYFAVCPYCEAGYWSGTQIPHGIMPFADEQEDYNAGIGERKRRNTPKPTATYTPTPHPTPTPTPELIFSVDRHPQGH